MPRIRNPNPSEHVQRAPTKRGGASNETDNGGASGRLAQSDRPAGNSIGAGKPGLGPRLCEWPVQPGGCLQNGTQHQLRWHRLRAAKPRSPHGLSRDRTVDWTYTAAHRTSQWSNYMPKQNWDPNAPLKRADLELVSTISHDGSAANTKPSHSITVPATVRHPRHRTSLSVLARRQAPWISRGLRRATMWESPGIPCFAME